VSAAGWRCLAEFALSDSAALAAAVRGLALPGFVFERVSEAVAAAAAREQDAREAISVRVLAPEAVCELPGQRRSWGFFQLQRLAEGPGRRHELEIYLFPE